MGQGRHWGGGEVTSGVGGELSGCPLAPGWIRTLSLGGAPRKRSFGGQAHVDLRAAGGGCGDLQPTPNSPLGPTRLGEHLSGRPPLYPGTPYLGLTVRPRRPGPRQLSRPFPHPRLPCLG